MCVHAQHRINSMASFTSINSPSWCATFALLTLLACAPALAPLASSKAK